MKKTIVCLANSRKPGGRCVAGKEYGKHGVGDWIRPINPQKYDGLSVAQVTCETGRDPRHLDLVEIRLTKHVPTLFQTENCSVEVGSTWRITGRFPEAHLPDLIDTPESLWLDRCGSPDGTNGYGVHDHVSAAIAVSKFSTSLHLIRPDSLKLSRSTENDKPKVRANFWYGGDFYRLGVTDRDVENALGERGNGTWVHEEGSIYLCVSLALPFNGNAYKLVAGIIGFNPTWLVPAQSSTR